MNKNNYYAQYLSLQPKTGAYSEILQNRFIPAIHPDLMGTVPIFEFQNLKQSGHSDFQEEKKTIWNLVLTLLTYPVVLCNTCGARDH